MTSTDDSLLVEVAKRLSQPPEAGRRHAAQSMLLQLANAYSSSDQLSDVEVTQPTGFNPFAATLFEAVLESAFLVANADGHFDDTERRAFVKVVQVACGGAVTDMQIEALLSDLSDLLADDGVDKRVEMVAKAISRPEHAEEVLRIAGLLAQVSDGVSDVERVVLEKLRVRFGLPPSVLDDVLGQVVDALAQ